MKSVILNTSNEVVAVVSGVFKSGMVVEYGYDTTTNELHVDKPKSIVSSKNGRISNAKKYQNTECQELSIQLNPGLAGYDSQFIIK